jgi:hypothetical protein
MKHYLAIVRALHITLAAALTSLAVIFYPHNGEPLLYVLSTIYFVGAVITLSILAIIETQNKKEE